MALGGLLSKLNPSQGGKVGGLSTVEALVEASMVAIGEGDDKVTGLLHHLGQQQTVGFIITLLSHYYQPLHKGGCKRTDLVERDGVLLQNGRRDHGHLVPQKARTLLKAVRKEP